MTSRHYTQDRKKREELIVNTIGLGNIVRSITIDKGHPNGPEIHRLSDTGIITVYNARTKKLVTRMVARPGQIKRFYGNNAPKELMSLARTHVELGYNYI